MKIDLKSKRTLWTLFGIYAVIIIIFAWVCDDAFITYDTVHMFWNGHGLVYNVGERVQVYTNPLMMFCMLIVGGITGEGYFSTLIINITASLIAFYLVAFKLIKTDENPYRGIAALLILILSKSYTAYSTSGMENSLEHLLIVIFCIQLFNTQKWSKKSLYLLCLNATLLLLCRYDMLLLVLPVLVYVFFFAARKDGVKLSQSIIFGVLGVLPFVFWEAFCLIYYGFLAPNTAYAKLNSDIPFFEYYTRGLTYFFANMTYDFVGVAAIVVLAVLVILNLLEKTPLDPRKLMLYIGSLCYLGYTVTVGGDFMAGRLYTPIILVSAILLSFIKIPQTRTKALPIMLICVFGASQYIGRSYLHPSYENVLDVRPNYIIAGSVADEMYFYENPNNLWLGIPYGWYKNHFLYRESVTMLTDNVGTAVCTGMSRLSVDDNIHIIDALALTDPLLARLPAIYAVNWRVGHLERAIPEGYAQTLQTGVNVITDPNIAEYYDKLHLITSGPIFSEERFKTIIDMNLGKYDYLIEQSESF